MQGKEERPAWVPWFWGVFWWLAVPGAVFFVGFKFVGPNIGNVPLGALQNSLEPQSKSAPPSNSEPVDEGAPTKADSVKEPKVDIEVERTTSKRGTRDGADPASQGKGKAKDKSKRKKPTPPKGDSTDPNEDPASGGQVPPPLEP